MSQYILIKDNTIINNIISEVDPTTESVQAIKISDFTSSILIGGVWNEVANDFIKPLVLEKSIFSSDFTSSVNLDLEFNNSIVGTLFSTSSIDNTHNSNITPNFQGIRVELIMTASLSSSDWPLIINIEPNAFTDVYGQTYPSIQKSFLVKQEEVNL